MAMVMKSVEEPAHGNKDAALCGCEYALCHLFLAFAAAVVALQSSVDPAVGGISGFISSAARLPFFEPWGLIGALGCWLAGMILIAMGAKRVIKVSILWRAALLILVVASATVAVVGLILTLQPSNARAGTDLSAFTDQERVYAEQLIRENYDCQDAIKAFVNLRGGEGFEYVSRVIDVDILGPGQYRALLQASNSWRLPTHRISLYYAERARVERSP